MMVSLNLFLAELHTHQILGMQCNEMDFRFDPIVWNFMSEKMVYFHSFVISCNSRIRNITAL